MAFVPLTDGAQFVFVYGASNVYYTNTLHATKNGFDESDVIAVKDRLLATWNALAVWPIPSGHTFRGLTVYDQRSDVAPVYGYALTSHAGTYTGEIADRQSALVVTFRTNRRGRSGRGRWYFGGATEGVMLNASYTNAYANNVLAWVNAVLADLATEGWTPVIKSTQQDGVPVTPANAYAIVSAEYRSLIPGSQDRRNKRP